MKLIIIPFILFSFLLYGQDELGYNTLYTASQVNDLVGVDEEDSIAIFVTGKSIELYKIINDSVVEFYSEPFSKLDSLIYGECGSYEIFSDGKFMPIPTFTTFINAEDLLIVGDLFSESITGFDCSDWNNITVKFRVTDGGIATTSAGWGLKSSDSLFVVSNPAEHYVYDLEGTLTNIIPFASGTVQLNGKNISLCSRNTTSIQQAQFYYDDSLITTLPIQLYGVVSYANMRNDTLLWLDELNNFRVGKIVAGNYQDLQSIQCPSSIQQGNHYKLQLFGLMSQPLNFGGVHMFQNFGIDILNNQCFTISNEFDSTNRVIAKFEDNIITSAWVFGGYIGWGIILPSRISRLCSVSISRLLSNSLSNVNGVNYCESTRPGMLGVRGTGYNITENFSHYFNNHLLGTAYGSEWGGTYKFNLSPNFSRENVWDHFGPYLNDWQGWLVPLIGSTGSIVIRDTLVIQGSVIYQLSQNEQGFDSISQLPFSPGMYLGDAHHCLGDTLYLKMKSSNMAAYSYLFAFDIQDLSNPILIDSILLNMSNSFYSADYTKNYSKHTFDNSHNIFTVRWPTGTSNYSAIVRMGWENNNLKVLDSTYYYFNSPISGITRIDYYNNKLYLYDGDILEVVDISTISTPVYNHSQNFPNESLIYYTPSYIISGGDGIRIYNHAYEELNVLEYISGCQFSCGERSIRNLKLINDSTIVYTVNSTTSWLSTCEDASSATKIVGLYKSNNIITSPSCNDGVQNGDETGVDCGGSICPACPTCSDGIQNGDETGIDCGGAICPACVSTGLDENNVSSFKIYPNPTKSSLTILGASTISIYDTMGRLIILMNNTNDKEVLDVSDLSTGVYQVKLSNGTNSKIQKLIIQR
jgi:hypothetical protein